MKTSTVALLFLSSLFVSRRAEAVVRVGYESSLHVGTWQPIRPDELKSLVERTALDVLSAPGLLQLSPIDPRSAPFGSFDYRLQLRGQIIDESESFMAYLSFSSAGKAELPSVAASETAVLRKLDRSSMASAVEAAARKAAQRLLQSLTPRLTEKEAPDTKPTREALENLALPFSWPEITVPQPSLARATDLYSKDHGKRQAALRELRSLSLGDESPRQALERCAMVHHDATMRLDCLVGLRPLSRRLQSTQLRVVEIFRKDQAGDIRAEASEQMMYFTGVARAAAVQAWVESASKGLVMGPMAALGDVPNLDQALRGCLVNGGKHPPHEKTHRACVELVGPLGHARRWALLWPAIKEIDPGSPLYLEGAGDREGSIGTVWQWAVEAVLEKATAWNPSLEEALWGRYQRTSSATAIRILGEYGAPSERLADRLIEALQTGGERHALWGLKRIARSAPGLRPRIREKLAELLHTGAHHKAIDARELEALVEELGRTG